MAGAQLCCGMRAYAIMGTFSLDRSLSVTCRWSAAKQDFLKALQLDTASGATDNAALLNNLGILRTRPPES